MKTKEYHFKSGDLLQQVDSFAEKGVLQVIVDDPLLTSNKEKFLQLLVAIPEKAPSVFFQFYIDPSILDKEIICAFADIFCSLHLYVYGQDRKNLSRKAALLNDIGLVFGFEVQQKGGDNPFASVREFRDLLDFLITLYPNHLYFNTETMEPTAKLSTQDIKNLERMIFAVVTFYSYGRAVPWFNAALAPLKIRPSQFFTDFAEWQLCNHCSLTDSQNGIFDVNKTSHSEIEKMQLHFLRLKYEEKQLSHLYTALFDMIRLQGAFSRVAAGEGNNKEISLGYECLLELSYHPDDLLSPFAMDIPLFVEEVCMETCKIRVFAGQSGPEIDIL